MEFDYQIFIMKCCFWLMFYALSYVIIREVIGDIEALFISFGGTLGIMFTYEIFKAYEAEKNEQKDKPLRVKIVD